MESRIQWDIHIAHTHSPCSIILLQENPLAQTTARQKDKNLLFFTYCSLCSPHSINDVNNGTDYIECWAHARFVSINISLSAKLKVLSLQYRSVKELSKVLNPSMRILSAWQWIWFNTENLQESNRKWRPIIALLEVQIVYLKHNISVFVGMFQRIIPVSSRTAESGEDELPWRAKLFRKTTPGQNQNKMLRIHGTY